MQSEKLLDNALGKIIIAEGLPGSGKSTWLCQKFQEMCRLCPCECYLEETSQPIDLFRQAIISKQDIYGAVDTFSQSFPEEKNNLLHWLQKNSYEFDEMMVVAYLQVANETEAVQLFAAGLRQYDIGDGRSTFDSYVTYHQVLWRRFASYVYDPNKVFLSEGSLFQNQLFDLIGFYELDDQAIFKYYKDLLMTFDARLLRIELIDVDDIDMLINHTLATRPGWMNLLNNWFLHAPWARHGHLNGIEGLKALYLRLQGIYRTIPHELGLCVHVYPRYFLK